MKFSIAKQRGYFLMIAVIFILVIGLMGTVIIYLFANSAQLSVAQQSGLRTFYTAETGLEVATRLLTSPIFAGTGARITCGNLTGTASITNASFGGGTLTTVAVNNVPNFVTTTLSGAITASSTSITLASAVGLASFGRIMIDREGIDYKGISGTTLLGVTRGTNGVMPFAHANSASVSQYQCLVDAKGGIPSVASSTYQRELQWGVALQDAWLVGNVSASSFTALNWNRVSEFVWTNNSFSSANAAVLNSIDMLSSGDLWAVGDQVSISGTRFFTILHASATALLQTTVAGACTSQDLQDVSMVSSQDGYAVGLRYRPACAGSGNFRYTLMRWNGTTWSLLIPTTIPADGSSATIQNLNAVHVIDTNANGIGDFGFAVGENGRILIYNGTNWTVSTSPTTQNLNGVAVVSLSEAWAVGAGGVILKWNGLSWSSFSSPVSVLLNEVNMYDSTGDGTADFGIAVGSSGRILTYNGSAWSTVTVGGANLFGVGIFNPLDAWVGGASGTLLHWDGSSWTAASSGLSQQLNHIAVLSPRNKPVSGWRQVFN